MANDTKAAPVSPTTSPGTSSLARKGELIAKVGTVVSAIVASSCCWLPLLLLAVGVSGAGIAATLAEYRWIFMIVTFAFLGMAFYFTYRPRRASAASGHPEQVADCCAPQATPMEQVANCCAPQAAPTAQVADCCAPQATPAAQGAAPAGRRMNMMAVNKIMLWVVTVLAVAFLFFPGYFASMLAGDTGTFTPDMTRTVFKVTGMTCEGCVPPAAKAIHETTGVLAVKIDYPTELATVGTAPDQPVPREKILAALEAVGFAGEFTVPPEYQKPPESQEP